MVTNATGGNNSPLQDDLVEMLTATRAAEQDLYAALAPARRDAPTTIGEWSARDVLAHLAAWRAIEADRLEAAARGEPDPRSRGVTAGESEDESNARLQRERAGWTWEEVEAEAARSTTALITAIRGTPTDELDREGGPIASIGGNGANHAIAHLADVARLAGRADRYETYIDEVRTILGRGRLPSRDAAVMVYNIACHHALSGELPRARELLRDAFSRRPDLLEWSLQDSDLAALHDELPALAAAATEGAGPEPA